MKVYVLVEERESSTSCFIHGVWMKKEDACIEMIKNIRNNTLYNTKSNINIADGLAESDPDYSEDEYCNYTVIEFYVK